MQSINRRAAQALLACLLALSVSLSTTAGASAQTQEEIDTATKLLKRPQTKSSTLAFFAGVAQGAQDYRKAVEYYGKLCALYELDNGPLSPKLAWACAKQAHCEALAGHPAKIPDLVSKTNSIIASWKTPPPNGLDFYLQEAKKTLKDVASANATTGTASGVDKASGVPTGATSGAASSKVPTANVSEKTVKGNELRAKPWMIELQLASTALTQGNRAGAKEHFRKAIDACEVPADDQMRVLAMVKLGDLLVFEGDLNGAEKLFNDIEKIAIRDPKNVDPIDLISAKRGQASILAKRGTDNVQAEKKLLNVVQLYKGMEPHDPKYRATWLVEMITTRAILFDLFKRTNQTAKLEAEKKEIATLSKEHEEIMRNLH